MKPSLLTLTGRVRGGPQTPLVRVDIDADGDRRSVAQSELFQIQLEDDDPDSVIDVAVTGSTALIPTRKIGGRFGELVGDELAKAVLSKAPGDHVDTELEGAVLEQGDRVAVYGEPWTEQRAGEGYREPAVSEIVTIDAAVVAIGDDGEQHIERWRRDTAQAKARAATKKAADRKKTTPRRENKPPDQLGLLPAGLMLAVSAAFLASVPLLGVTKYAGGEDYLLVGAAIALAAALFVWRSRRWMPSFRKVGHADKGAGLRWATLPYVLITVIVAIPLSILTNHVPGAAAAPLLVFFVANLWRDQRSAMTAGSLLRAKPLSADLPEGAFGSVEGRIEDGFVAVTRTHQDVSRQVQVTRQDKDGNSFQTTETRTTTYYEENWSGGDLVVETESESIDMKARGGQWAGDYTVGENRRLNVRAEHGDAILVAGRCTRKNGAVQFRATGPGSLMFFSSDEGSSPRDVLRSERRLHYLGLLGQLVAMAVIVLLGLL